MHTVIIDVDAVRADMLGAYGADHDVTPAIDALASDGVVFEQAYAANTPSLPSRAALVSGRYGVSNGVVTHGPRAYTISSPHTWDTADRHRRSYRTLPALLYHEDVSTRAVASGVRHPAPWFAPGWETLTQPREPTDADVFMQVDGATVADRAQGLLEQGSGEGSLLYTQFWDAHAPYDVPEEFRVAAEDVALPPYPTMEQIGAAQEREAWPCDRGVVPEDRAGLARLYADYLSAVHYLDAQVGRLLQELKDRGLYDESLIVFTADHGEEFGEHGVYREHWSTYDGTQRVPLIIKPPTGMTAADRCDALVTNVDIAPTIADVHGVDPARAWQGESLRDAVEGGGSLDRERLVLEHGLYTAQRAIRTDRWKLIRTYHPGHWDDLPALQLFDVSNDPWEQEDVSGEHGDVVQRLMERMRRFVDDHIGRDGDPLKAVARDGPPGARR